MSWTLWTSAVLALVSTAVFTYAARTVLSRHADSSSRPAIIAFATWWVALAIATLSQALMRIVGASGLATVPLVQTQLHVAALSICVSVAALLYYFVFLRWGRSSLWPIVSIYAAVYTYYLYLLSSARPTGVRVGTWRVYLEQAASSSGSRLLPLLLLVAPPIVGALLYWPLVSRAKDADVRYRGRLISVAIITWFSGTVALGFVTDEAFRALVSHAAGLMAAAVTLFAYRPPKLLQRRKPPRTDSGRSSTSLPPHLPEDPPVDDDAPPEKDATHAPQPRARPMVAAAGAPEGE